MALTDALAMAVSPASDARACGAPDAASMPGSSRSIASSRSMAVCSVGWESRTTTKREVLASGATKTAGASRGTGSLGPTTSATPGRERSRSRRPASTAGSVAPGPSTSTSVGAVTPGTKPASTAREPDDGPAREAEPELELAQRRGRHDEPADQHDDDEAGHGAGGEEAGGERRPGLSRPGRVGRGQPPAGPEGAPAEDRQQRGQQRDRHDDADDGREGEGRREGAEEVHVAHQQRGRSERGREPGRQHDGDHVGARSHRGPARVAPAQPGAHAEQVEDRVVRDDADEERGDHRLDVPARGDPGGVGDGADRVDVDQVGDRDGPQHDERGHQRAEDDRDDQGDQGERHADHEGEPVVDGLDLILPHGRRAGEARGRAGRDRGRGDVVAAEARLAGDRGGLAEREVGEDRGRAPPRARRHPAGAGQGHGRGDLLEAGDPAPAHVEGEPPEGRLLGDAEATGTADDHLGARDEGRAEDVGRAPLGGERRGVVGQRELQVRRPAEPGQGQRHRDRRRDPAHHDDVAQCDDRAAEEQGSAARAGSGWLAHTTPLEVGPALPVPPAAHPAAQTAYRARVPQRPLVGNARARGSADPTVGAPRIELHLLV